MTGPVAGARITSSQPENKASGWFWGVNGENGASSGTPNLVAWASCVHYE